MNNQYKTYLMIFFKIVSPRLYIYTAGMVISRFPINSIQKTPEILEYRLCNKDPFSSFQTSDVRKL